VLHLEGALLRRAAPQGLDGHGGCDPGGKAWCYMWGGFAQACGGLAPRGIWAATASAGGLGARGAKPGVTFEGGVQRARGLRPSSRGRVGAGGEAWTFGSGFAKACGGLEAQWAPGLRPPSPGGGKGRGGGLSLALRLERFLLRRTLAKGLDGHGAVTPRRWAG